MKKILAVDDSDKGLTVLVKILSGNGYEVVTANNGSKALEVLKKEKVSLIILDIMMPEMDGFETISRLKQNPMLAEIPVIFLTSQAEYEDIDRAFEMGAVDYILKPVRKKELLARVNTQMELAEKTRMLSEENKELFEQKSSLLRFFSEDVADSIIQGKMENKMKGEIIPVSIFFMDIRNFTGISENLKPELVADLLNTLFTDIMDIVFTHRGSVNKLIGDAILATFGAPVQSDKDALNAVKCALSVQNMITLFNKAKPEYLKDDIRVGIGIATGEVFAGNIGSFRRIEYTVIGDTVNTASRLESMTKSAGVSILIDETTAGRLDETVKTEFLTETDVKGKEIKIKIYSIAASKESEEANDEVTFF